MKTFEVSVGVNKDGTEVYRVQAESVEDAVRKARAAADDMDVADEFELVRDDTSCNATCWDEVTAADVKEVELTWTRTPPATTGFYWWRDEGGTPEITYVARVCRSARLEGEPLVAEMPWGIQTLEVGEWWPVPLEAPT